MAVTWFTNESGAINSAVVPSDGTPSIPASDVGYAAQSAIGSTMTLVAGAMHGSKALRIAPASETLNWVRITPTGMSSTSPAVTMYVKFDVAATQDQTVLAFMNSGAKVIFLNRQGTNRWRLTDQAVTNAWTGAASIPLSTYVRIECFVKLGATASAGTIDLVIYDGDTNTILDQFQSSVLTLGTNPITAIYTGKYDSGTHTGPITLDTMGIEPAATTRIGKYSVTNAAPTLTAPNFQTVAPGDTVAVTFPEFDDAGIVSRTTTFDFASNATTITNPGSATSTFTAGPEGSLYLVRRRVTDAAGLFAEAVTEVRVSKSTELRPLSAPIGTWAGVGGTTSAVLADDSDATYYQSPTVTASEEVIRFRMEPSVNRTTGTITLRLSKSDSGAANVTARLYQGAGATVPLDTWTIVPTTTPADYTRNLSNTVITSISDWGGLRVELGVIQ